MIRKLILPLVAVALLGGCVTSGYSYRQGSGDYYYGAPSVEYRYHSSNPYYSPYSYGQPYYSYGGHYYSGAYGYGNPYGYYRHPYTSVYYSPRYYYYNAPARPPVDPSPVRPPSPWRNLNQLPQRSLVDPASRKRVLRLPSQSPPLRSSMPQSRMEMPSQPSRVAPAPRGDSGAPSGMVPRVPRIRGKGAPGDETTP